MSVCCNQAIYFAPYGFNKTNCAMQHNLKVCVCGLLTCSPCVVLDLPVPDLARAGVLPQTQGSAPGPETTEPAHQ